MGIVWGYARTLLGCCMSDACLLFQYGITSAVLVMHVLNLSMVLFGRVLFGCRPGCGLRALCTAIRCYICAAWGVVRLLFGR